MPIATKSKKSYRTIAIVFLICGFLAFFWLGPSLRKAQIDSRQILQNSATTTADNENNDERQALALVGFDDDGVVPSTSDIRVRKAKILLRTLATEFNTTPFEVNVGIESAVKLIERNYQVKVLRLSLLEDYSEFHFKLGSEDRKRAAAEKIKDTIMLYAILKYGK